MKGAVVVYLVAGLFFATLLSKVGEASPARPKSMAARTFAYLLVALLWPIIIGWLLATTKVEKADRV